MQSDMKNIGILSLCWLINFFFWGLFLSADSVMAKDTLTIEKVTNGAYSPTYIYGVHPLNDGENYSQLSADGKRIVRCSFKTGKEVNVIFDVEQARGKNKLTRIDGYIMSPDEKKILLQTQTRAIYRRTFTAVYYIYDVVNRKFEPLSEGGPQISPLFSPDGNVVAFARDNDLFVVKLLYNNAETRVTRDGKRNAIINGIPDWVNEEEFSTSRSFDFTADSKMLCWIRYDETKVPVYHIQMFEGRDPDRREFAEYPGSYDYKYPIAGAVNSSVTVHSYDLKSRVSRQLAIPVDSDGYIPRIVGTSDPDRLAVVTLNRHQNQMDLFMVNPRSGLAKMVLRETDKRYLRETVYTGLKFYPEHFALLSERTGYQHLYWYALSGKLEQTITKGDFEVEEFYGFDVRKGIFCFSAHKESPLQTNIYCVDRRGHWRTLAGESGTHHAIFSSDMRYFLDVYSSVGNPPVTSLKNEGGKTLEILEANEKLKAQISRIGTQQELFNFTLPDGTVLYGWMLKPADFDARKKYPVIMYQYSGPGSQEVKDAWNNGFYGGGVWESFLAQHGYVCVVVDGRGTGARGAAFEKCTYLKLGDIESKDQIATAQYLATLPFVDASRIGIWGWSFGGFNTLMAMTDGHPIFKCGVAVAAPSNWKYYDTVYTERYMRTPKENAQYDQVNPIARANKLQGNLLLVHGTADDNVHYRNCAEISEALVQAGKPFDMQIYTNRNHSIYGGNTRSHLFRRIFEFFEEHMK